MRSNFSNKTTLLGVTVLLTIAITTTKHDSRENKSGSKSKSGKLDAFKSAIRKKKMGQGSRETAGSGERLFLKTLKNGIFLRLSASFNCLV